MEVKFNESIGVDEQTFVSRNIGMVYEIADSFYGKSLNIRQKTEFDDLLQEGFIGLVTAYRNYEPSKGDAKPESYAYTAVQRTILRYLNYKIDMIHVPTKKRDKHHFLQVTEREEPGTETRNSIFDMALQEEFNDEFIYVADFMNGMDEQQKEIILLLMQGMNIYNIAPHVGKSHQAVGKRVETIQNMVSFYLETGRHKKRGEKVQLSKKTLSVIKPEYREKFIKRIG